MAFIKITEPGSEHTMTVAKVEDDRSGSWPDWKFSDAQGNVLAIPQKAMERQLTRLEVDTAFDLVGSTVRFSRSTELGKNGKPFYNADLVNAAAASPKPSKRIPPPNAARSVGPHIPGLDDEPSPYEDPGPIPPWHKVAPVEEPRQTPREQREARGEAEPPSAREVAYLELWGRVAARLAAICSSERIPLDASAVQAACATITIQNGR